MGFLDSDFGKVLLGGTRYGQFMLRQDEENSRAQEFKNLAATYAEHQLPPDQAGPVQNAHPVDQNFAMQTLGIPGYQQVGTNMLDQLQRRQTALDLQNNQNDWLAHNEPMAQKLMREQGGQQFDRAFGNLSEVQKQTLLQQRQLEGARLQQADKQWSNISPYQKAALGIQQQEADYRNPALLGKGSGGAMPGSPLYDSQLKEQQVYTAGVDNVQKLIDLYGETGVAPGVFDRATLAKAAPYRTAVMSALTQVGNSGTLNEGEKKTYDEVMGDPGFFQSKANLKERLLSVQELLKKYANLTTARNPNLPAPAFPTGFKKVN